MMNGNLRRLSNMTPIGDSGSPREPQERYQDSHEPLGERYEVHIGVYRVHVWDSHGIYRRYFVVHVGPTGEMFGFPSGDHR